MDWRKVFYPQNFFLSLLCIAEPLPKPPYPAEHAPLQLHLQAVNPELLLKHNTAASQASSLVLGGTPKPEKVKAVCQKKLCWGAPKLAATTFWQEEGSWSPWRHVGDQDLASAQTHDNKTPVISVALWKGSMVSDDVDIRFEAEGTQPSLTYRFL